MQDVNTFLNAGWDFIGETTNGTNVVWQMPSGVGYPVLSSFNGYSPPLLAGNGTSANPYLIGDPNELGAIYHYDNNANYRLVADIDLSGINWSTSPIPFFRGYFDGNGYTIRALTIEGGGHLGLFGWIDNYGDINNLDLIELNIDAVGDFAGTLAGYNLGIIRDCCATGNISGRNYSDYLGGLVGRNWAGSISNSYATGNVIGGDDSTYLGGLAGYNNGNISNCYTTGSVSDGDNSYYLGGLVGYNDGGSISNCYATGSVSGGDDSRYLGGLVGKNYGSISNCYATGSISGSSYLGNLVGYDYRGSYSSSFWNSDVNPGLTGVGG